MSGAAVRAHFRRYYSATKSVKVSAKYDTGLVGMRSSAEPLPLLQQSSLLNFLAHASVVL